MKILVTGGVKNGKTDYAQELTLRLANGGKRYYVATMLPWDEEDRLRIRLHRENRAGMGFETLEQGRSILSCLDTASKNGAFLLDSTTALLMNELFSDTVTFRPNIDAAEQCVKDLVTFAQCAENIVIVSDGMYTDAAIYDEATELYRKYLAKIDRALATVCDTVIEVTAGIPIAHKGELPL